MANSAHIAGIVAVSLAAVVLAGCSTQRKLTRIRESERVVHIQLPERKSTFRELKDDYVQQDTITVTDLEGNQVIFMETLVDEEGNEVAHETLQAARVTARFRNVAERGGKVSIEFEIVVPQELVDSRWQVRFQPQMYILQDSLMLEPVIITGTQYREEQLRGYELYNRFINSIVTDSTRFINIDALEVFLERNIPEVFVFKNDSSYVSERTFSSRYGATQREAVRHYTHMARVRSNDRRAGRRQKMYEKYVKSPIVYDGIRLDTLMNAATGDVTYLYAQSFDTRPKLRKVDIVLSGEIYEQERRIYTVPKTDKLTFYISSLNTFVRDIVRYRTRIIERRAEANITANIGFSTGRWDIDTTLAGNAAEMAGIRRVLRSLMSDEVYDIDSITVNATASPEGLLSSNEQLAARRSESVSEHFSAWMQSYRDSLETARGFAVDEKGNIVRESFPEIRFIARNGGEDWDGLDRLVERDTVLTEDEKGTYARLREIGDADRRERRMKDESFYAHVRNVIYPQLRSVRFDFHMHRKGMVKDTVHTTVVDEEYMAGVQALRDMDYETALEALRPYGDYNTAVAYCATGRNASALAILEGMERDAQVNYMLAVIYSREGRLQEAVQCYTHSCQQDPSYVHRGNLDPEIAGLIERFGLNRQEEIPTDF